MDTNLEVLERVLLATVTEQRRARRWKIAFRIMAFAVVVCALLLNSPLDLVGEGDGRAQTAKIEVNGPIGDSAGASADNVKRSLAAAFKDPKTRGVVLEINSPGGSPVAAGLIYDEIKRQRVLHPDVKVYAVIGDLGASGAYYIASAADLIYADKASLVGSIGVTAATFGFVDLMSKLGVERRAYTSGEHKAFLDQFQPRNEGETLFWQNVLGTTHQQFITAVKNGRGDRLKSAEHPELFSGLIWTGEQALKLGLIDQLGDTDLVARDVIQQETIVDFTRKENPFDRFASKLGASVANEISQMVGISGVRLQ